MFRWLIERKLTNVSTRLRGARGDLAVLQAQAAHFRDEADDSHVRALVSDSPAADHDYREDRRHADTFAKERERLTRQISALERRQDVLLDKLSTAASSPPAGSAPGVDARGGADRPGANS